MHTNIDPFLYAALNVPRPKNSEHHIVDIVKIDLPERERLMFSHILVPLDGSSFAEAVLPHAVAFAKTFNAQISLLQVLDRSTTVEGAQSVDPLNWQLKKTEADLYLSAVKTRLEKDNLTIQKQVLEGRTADQIVEFAQSGKVDLLMLSSRGQQGLSNWNVSAIVQHILQRIRISTLIVRANQPVPAQLDELHYQRLLIPLDGSRRAESTVPAAISLAQAHGAELLIVHVVAKPEMARRMPLTQEDTDLLNRVVERNQEEGNLYLEQLQSHLSEKPRTTLLVSDNVAATIQGFVEQEQVDLLILSAHGYSGDARWSYGSLTNRFITDGTAPLLIIQDLPVDPTETSVLEVATRQPGR